MRPLVAAAPTRPAPRPPQCRAAYKTPGHRRALTAETGPDGRAHSAESRRVGEPPPPDGHKLQAADSPNKPPPRSLTTLGPECSEQYTHYKGLKVTISEPSQTGTDGGYRRGEVSDGNRRSIGGGRCRSTHPSPSDPWCMVTPPASEYVKRNV